MVRIKEGPFANFNGVVEDFDMASGILKLNVSIFGRNTPVEITVYSDKSFTFVLKQPPMTDLIKKAAGIKKGSDNPLKNKIASLTKEQVLEIVEMKIADLNTNDKEQAAKIVAGSARSMGITTEL
jgi:large subunit ribosomal protein L11